mmetsp:Transcript_41764/g.135083  ORF Transcript_41764/g.135083 Transcript_41764/m.135083 type:complete len:1182 (+) Transcript_41764:195-3740(+)
MADAKGNKKMKRLQLAMEEEELRSLRIPSSAHRGHLSPSKNAFLPTLQEQTQDHSLSRRTGSTSARRSLGAVMRQGPQSARGPVEDGSRERSTSPPAKFESLLNQHVLGHITAEWLHGVKQDFFAQGGALNLNQFVGAMLRSLEAPNMAGGATGSTAEVPKKTVGFGDGGSGGGYPGGGASGGVHDRNGRTGRTAALVDLFRRVDVHGEGSITWDEVSNYLIDHGVAGGDEFTVDSIRSYRQSPTLDASKHDQPVEKLVYLEQMDVVACLSHKTRGFRLYDPARCTVKQEVSGHRGHRGSLVNCCYVRGLNQIATTGADMSICLWDQSSLGLRNRLTAKDVQLCLCGSTGSDSLFSGAIDGTLSRWDLSNMCLSETRKGQHKDAINDLLMIEDLNLLASASSDGSTIMWDLETMRPKKTFKGHRKGTFSLAYSQDYRCLLTAGLEQEALVWNPYVERVPIFRLKGHVNALCGVAVVPGTPQVISADVKGVFRLWDIRNFRCIQSFGGKESRINNLSTFCVLPSHRRIMAGGSFLANFDYMDDGDGESVTEVGGVTDALYNPHVGEFYTLSQSHVKAWSANTGSVFKVLSDISRSEITACCLAENGRKLFLGDSAGRVAAHSVHNGALLSEFEPHAKDISCLEVWPGTNKIFSASWDGALKLQIDDRARKPYTKAEFNHHKDGVTCLACSAPLMLLATGGTDTQVCIYDLKSLKLEHSLARMQHVISSLDFLEKRCLLAVADLGGFVSLWRTRPHPDRWQQVYHFSNLPSMGDASLRLTLDRGPAVALHALKFEPQVGRESEQLRLFTADAKGGLRCWDLSRLCERRGIVEVNLAQLFKSKHGMASPRPAVGADVAAAAEEGAAGADAGEAEAGAMPPDAGDAAATFCTGMDEERAAQEPRQKPIVGSTVRSALRAPAATAASAAAAAVAQEGDRSEVELLVEIQAHDDGITKLHMIGNPPSLVSCGHDCRVRAWSLQLKRLGDLLIKRDQTYHFPYDPMQAQKAKLEEAAELLKSIRPWTPPGAGKKVPRLPKMPPTAPGATAFPAGGPSGMLDSLCSGGRAHKADPDEKWKQEVDRVIADPNAEGVDYEQLFEQLGQFGQSTELDPVAAAAHERLLRNALARQVEHLPQRSKALSSDEASAADRLARAMAAVGGDDFGCYAAMATRIRPRSIDRALYSAR